MNTLENVSKTENKNKRRTLQMIDTKKLFDEPMLSHGSCSPDLELSKQHGELSLYPDFSLSLAVSRWRQSDSGGRID